MANVENGGQFHGYVAGPLPDRSGDRMTGHVSLAGTLEVVLEDGFEPKLDDRFLLMTYRELQGRFEHTKLPELAEPLEWQLEYTDQELILAVGSRNALAGSSMVYVIVSAVGLLIVAGICYFAFVRMRRAKL